MDTLLRYRRLVYAVVLTGFILLLVVQVAWLRYTWMSKEREFTNRISLSLGMHGSTDQLMSTLLDDILTQANDKHSALPPSLKKLHSILDSLPQRNNLPQHYVFGISKSSEKVSWVSDTSYSSEISNSPFRLFILPEKESNFWCISFIFPDKTKYLLSNLAPQILLSVFLSSALAFCCFALVINTRRQAALAKMKTDFINHITHELKMPLSTISIVSKMLDEQAATGNLDQQDACLQSLRKEISRLNQLVETALTTELLHNK